MDVQDSLGKLQDMDFHHNWDQDLRSSRHTLQLQFLHLI